MGTTYTVTTSFAADTTAVASEINQNFTDVLTALNSFDATNLTGTIALARISNLTSSQMASTYFKDEDNMTSNSATAVSSQQALKAYADTKESTIVTQSTASLFGSWTNLDSLSATLVKDGVYQVGSDGFVCTKVTDTNSNYILRGYTDGSNPPTTVRVNQLFGSGVQGWAGFTMPVRKDDYWEVTSTQATGSPTIYWLPIGTGGCVKQ